MSSRVLLFSIFLVSIVSCNAKLFRLSYTSIQSLESFKVQKDEQSGLVKRCDVNEAYSPNEKWAQKRYVRVNFHIMDDVEGSHNFPESAASVTYFKQLLENANYRLSLNKKMNLPIDNDTPVLDPGFRYVLTPNSKMKGDNGIYFHRDNDLYYFVNKGKNRNNFKRDVIKKYGRNQDSILNIFVLPHHPDSISSKSYKGGGTGIALGTSLKVAGLYDDKLEFWGYSTLLNHEIGHILGLNHSWYKNDGCDDTPPHANCWAPNMGASCDGDVVSNNVMDYNASQMAFTPCQLGKIHKGFARENSDTRGLITQNWCDFDANNFIVITKDTHWDGAKDLNRDVIVEAGTSLSISCRVSMAKGSKILIQRGANLILNNCRIHNSCGEEWLGIKAEIESNETPNIKIIGDVLLENITGQSQIIEK